MYQKDFDLWNEVKKRVQGESRAVYIRAGEIRWITFGVNIGSEIDGKGVSFFEWKGTTISLCLHQMKIISQKRILERKGKISQKRLQIVKQQVQRFYSMS